MANKSELKSRIRRYKKRMTRLRKIVKIGLKSIEAKDAKIAQLTSVLELKQ